MDTLEDRVKKLEQEIEKLRTRRTSQADYIPDSIKQRHIGEGVRFIQAGLEADRPSANIPMQGQQIYFCTDSFKLFVYTGTAWKSVTLS